MDQQPYSGAQPKHSQNQQFQREPFQRNEATNEQAVRHGSPGAGSASCSSPRRRKPTIDIDTALFLQSQAEYVQEPAGNKQRAAGNVEAELVQFNAAAAAAAAAAPATKAAAAAASNKHTLAPETSTLCANNNSNNNTRQTFEPSRGAGLAPTYCDYNISVDYIDCLANTDLQASIYNQQQQQAATQRPPTENMRGLSSCGRKHFSRFHRAHKIEPDSDGGAAGQQQQSQTTQQTLAGPSESSSLVTTTNSLGGDDPLNFDRHNQQQQQSTSVLYPISVSEVKKRTYFIGSVCQDSLLGHDELYRYFPQARVNIFVCTWNQNRKRAPTNLKDLLLPDQLVFMPDIYAIGIQEAFSSQADYLRDWDIELQTTLGPNHVLLHSCSLGVLHLSIFVRRDLIWFCSTPEESLYNSRSMPTNMIKTKGAVSIAFRFFGTSFMFTNCHFPAHENKLRDRIDEYQRIINSIDLPKDLKLLKPRYLSNDSTARFDCVFLMGDLNFRLEQRTFDETIQILDDIFQSQGEQSFEILTQNDELLKVMETQQAFHGFDESQIRFPPTYKFLAQTNKYDRQSKRVPSYTDRILFRSKRQRHIQCLIYDWLPQLMSSDHKPVYCLFDVLIRPGREQNMISSLNAGLFQRAIYIEALKRRAEDSDGLGRENGVGGNLICSIS